MIYIYIYQYTHPFIPLSTPSSGSQACYSAALVPDSGAAPSGLRRAVTRRERQAMHSAGVGSHQFSWFDMGVSIDGGTIVMGIPQEWMVYKGKSY